MMDAVMRRDRPAIERQQDLLIQQYQAEKASTLPPSLPRPSKAFREWDWALKKKYLAIWDAAIRFVVDHDYPPEELNFLLELRELMPGEPVDRFGDEIFVYIDQNYRMMPSAITHDMDVALLQYMYITRRLQERDDAEYEEELRREQEKLQDVDDYDSSEDYI